MKRFVTLEIAKILWEKRLWISLDHVYVLNEFEYTPPFSDQIFTAKPGDFIINFEYCNIPDDLNMVKDVIAAPMISEVADMLRDNNINIYAKSVGEEGYTYVIQYRGVEMAYDPFNIFKDYDACMNRAIEIALNKYFPKFD